MNAQEILKQYDIVRTALTGTGLPEMEQQTYTLTVTFDVLDNAKDVNKKLADIKPIAGWLGYQSGNQHFDQTALPEAPDKYGLLLNAEVTNGNGKSVHVRYNGNGGWIVTKYCYTQGGDYVVDQLVHLASNEDLGELKYRRFWKTDENSLGVNPVYACFTGFGG